MSWFELFYDLVLVASVLHGSKVFDQDPSVVRGAWLASTLLVLLTIWLLTTLTFNTAHEEWTLRRFVTLVQMLALVIASLSISRTGGLSDSLGLVAMGVAFASVAVLYVIKARRGGRDQRGAVIVGWSTAAAALVCCVGSLLPEPSGQFWTHPTTYAFGLAVALGVVPLMTVYVRELAATGSLDREHLSERVGQLVIIALGESFADLILTLGGFDELPNPVFLALTFGVIYAVWAIYFRTVVPAGIPHRAGQVRMWIAAHYLLILGAIGTAAGFAALAVVSLDDASAALASYRLPLPLFYVMLSCVVLTWLAGRPARRFLRIHAVAAALLLGLGFIGATVVPDRAVTMGVVAAVIVFADIAAVAWASRRKGEPYEVS